MTTYLTTAIPYVNAAPHLGHALELVQADTLARHRRLRGEPVRFLTGTDDNALKNVTAARAAGQDVRTFVDTNAARFAALRQPLDLSFDDFIRTSADPRHAPGVERLWRECADDLYLRSYEGRYCPGCEQFLIAELCPEHFIAPEPVAERNWFFRLSRHTDQLLKILETDLVRVEPPARRNEVLAFVRAGLEDFSVSRPAARAGGWGVPVPDDPSQSSPRPPATRSTRSRSPTSTARMRCAGGCCATSRPSATPTSRSTGSSGAMTRTWRTASATWSTVR
jgi:methionyl-tRNA synthetase